MAFHIALHLSPLVRPDLTAFRKRLAARLGRAEVAHDRRLAVVALQDIPSGELGMSSEEAAGHPAWQEDLPFFMQAGFGQR